MTIDKRENLIEKEIRLRMGRSKTVRLFRNSVGLGLVKGVMVRFGLLKGSGDLIGWRTVTITDQMVGQKIAQFVSCENKTRTGRLRGDQRMWLEMVRRFGGCGIVARSADDAELQLHADFNCDTLRP